MCVWGGGGGGEVGGGGVRGRGVQFFSLKKLLALVLYMEQE